MCSVHVRGLSEGQWVVGISGKNWARGGHWNGVVIDFRMQQAKKKMQQLGFFPSPFIIHSFFSFIFVGIIEWV